MKDSHACPICLSEDPKQVSFTWWGGKLGPWLCHHVRCQRCGATYNGKTGQSNTVAIIVYLSVSIVIGLGVVVLIEFLRH